MWMMHTLADNMVMRIKGENICNALNMISKAYKMETYATCNHNSIMLFTKHLLNIYTPIMSVVLLFT